MNDIKYCDNYILDDMFKGLRYYLSSKRHRRFMLGQIKYHDTYPSVELSYPDIDIPF